MVVPAGTCVLHAFIESGRFLARFCMQFFTRVRLMVSTDPAKRCQRETEQKRCGGPGGVAQLGERLNGIQEVRGSIPLTSMQAADVVRFGSSVEVVRVSHRLIR